MNELLNPITLPPPEGSGYQCVFPSVCRAAPDGTLLLVDEIGHSILKFSAVGEFIKAIGGRGTKPGEFHYPTDAAFGSDGDVYVTDRWNHRVQIFDWNTLKFKHAFGKAGTGKGDLLEPYGITFYNGSLVVAERENERFSVYAPGGEFKFHVHKPMGLKDGMRFPTSLCTAGRYLLAVTAPADVIVFNDRYHCENIIHIPDESGVMVSLYPAANDTFIVSGEPGLLSLYGVDGTKIWTKNISASGQTKETDDTPHITVALATNITEKYFTPVRVTLPEASLPEIAKEIYPEGEKRNIVDFYRQIASGSDLLIDDWPDECLSNIPDKFQTSCFLTALDLSAENPEAFRPILNQYISRYAAVPWFRETVQSHPGAPEDIREFAGMKAPRLVETIDIKMPDPRDPLAIAVARGDNDDFIAIPLQNGGIVRFRKNHVEMISDHGPSLCMSLWKLRDGSFLAVINAIPQMDIIHLSTEGKTLRRFVSLTKSETDLLHTISPCLKDDDNFFHPNVLTGKVEVININSGDIAIFGNIIFDKPLNAAYDAQRGFLYILQLDQTLITLDDSGRERARIMLEPPTPDFHASRMYPAFDGKLLIQFGTWNTSLFGCPYSISTTLAKICPETGRFLFAIPSFILSDSDFDEVEHFRMIHNIMMEDENKFWVQDINMYRLYRFAIR